MRRGTTPTLRVKVRGIAVEELTTMYLTIKQGSVELTKDNFEIDDTENRLIVTLTQAETLAFDDGACQIQLRAMTRKGQAVASTIVTMRWEHILLEGEIQ